ncbi:MAG: hypothetical protein IPM82_26040 [Saprospiraceae bacterium]|nr:hypothetical protein [Saprospiraceae bacterium]
MLGAPGIMGWYSFVPFMQCFHGLVSLHHRLSGQMQVYGQPVDFGGGIGYLEKDWGTSFPPFVYLDAGQPFFASGKDLRVRPVAHIPWLRSYFIGYIVGFQWGDTLYRFATYTGASMKAALGSRRCASLSVTTVTGLKSQHCKPPVPCSFPRSPAR